MILAELCELIVFKSLRVNQVENFSNVKMFMLSIFN